MSSMSSIPMYKLTTDQKCKTSKVFHNIDREKSGFVVVRELHSVLNGLNISIDTGSLELVANRFHTRRDGKLNLDQFSQVLFYLLDKKKCELETNPQHTGKKIYIRDEGGRTYTFTKASSLLASRRSSTRSPKGSLKRARPPLSCSAANTSPVLNSARDPSFRTSRSQHHRSAFSGLRISSRASSSHRSAYNLNTRCTSSKSHNNLHSTRSYSFTGTPSRITSKWASFSGTNTPSRVNSQTSSSLSGSTSTVPARVGKAAIPLTTNSTPQRPRMTLPRAVSTRASAPAYPTPPPPSGVKASLKRIKNFITKVAQAKKLFTKQSPVDTKPKKPRALSRHVSIPDFFVDETFPADKSVLPRHCRRAVVSWKRAHELCENPQLFVNGSEATDVVQGSLGDCWFMGALAVLASSEQNGFIESAFIKADVKRGEYECCFYKDGSKVTVKVDDRLPCGINGKPYFASCLDTNELWVPILEKAYAKLHGGYGAIESGSLTDALKDMSGHAVEIIRVDEDPKYKDKSKLWKALLRFKKESFLMGCAIENCGVKTEEADDIIDCQEVEGHQLLRIRNPWAKKEWNGPWSDESSEWTPSLKDHFNYEFGNDGTFFMEFSDFAKFFNRIHVLCLLTDDEGEVWYQTRFLGQWRGPTAGGCTNYGSWPNNPQYVLKSVTDSPTTKVFVGLSQGDLRYKHKKGPMQGMPKYPPIKIR